MHEWDAEEAITLAVERQLRGVFNVAGPPPVPLSIVCEATGKTAVRIPEPLYSSVLGRFGFPYLPPSAIAHVKYPIVIDNSAFVEATGFEPRYTAKQTMEGFRWN
jgi:UDP-glucose 4-epimerase